MAEEIGKLRGEDIAEVAIEAIEKRLAADFGEKTYNILRAQLRGMFSRFYVSADSVIGSTLINNLIRNQEKQKKESLCKK